MRNAFCGRDLVLGDKPREMERKSVVRSQPPESRGVFIDLRESSDRYGMAASIMLRHGVFINKVEIDSPN